MPLLTREAMLAADTRPIVTVECPELGGTVCLRALSGAEASFVYGKAESDQAATIRACVALSVCDEAGDRLFTMDDVAMLFERHSFSAMQPIVARALEINRMSKEGADSARKA